MELGHSIAQQILRNNELWEKTSRTHGPVAQKVPSPGQPLFRVPQNLAPGWRSDPDSCMMETSFEKPEYSNLNGDQMHGREPS